MTSSPSLPTYTTDDLNPYRKGCPTRRILDHIGGTWTVLVIGALRDSTLRFSELHRRVEGISQKMLTQTLRTLERDGLVLRTQHDGVPLRVDYSLTPSGRSLLAPLETLQQWSIDHFAGVSQSQLSFDQVHDSEKP